MTVTSGDWILSIFMLTYGAYNLTKYLWYFGWLQMSTPKGKLELAPLFKTGQEMKTPNLFIYLHVGGAILLCIFWSLLLTEVVVLKEHIWINFIIPMQFLIIIIPFMCKLGSTPPKKACLMNMIPVSYLLIFTILYVVYKEKVWLRTQAGLIVMFAFIEMWLIVMNRCWKKKQEEVKKGVESELSNV